MSMVSSQKPRHEHRLRFAVALTFPVYPPLGGGQARAYHLYRELARHADVELVSLALPGTRERRLPLAPGLWERRVPKSMEHAEREMALEREAGAVVTDIAMGQLHHLTPGYAVALSLAADSADAVVASHPYTYRAIREATDAPLCYEAQDVEATLKADLLGDTDAARSLLREVVAIEQACVREAELTWTCSAEDRHELIRRYGADSDRIVVVPNGAPLDELRYTPLELRHDRRRRLQIREGGPSLFMASWHQPNVDAALTLLEVATRTPATEYLILGSVGFALADRRLPENVRLTGPMATEFKQAVLDIADVALNPVTTGSGTNIKMLDYFGSGAPVISTEFGARGLGVTADEHYVQAEPRQFEVALDRMREFSQEQISAMTRAAREHVERELSWSAIADGLFEHLSRRFEAQGGRPHSLHDLAAPSSVARFVG
jgi:glycosyltransferase involved in cell wall biosynthesis